MTRDETKIIIAMIANGYSKHLMPSIDSHYINMWSSFFEDLSFQAVEAVTKKWLMTEKYPPSIADIRQGVTELSLDTKDASEAWQEVLGVIRKYGNYQKTEALEALSEETRVIVERFGYETFSLMETKEERTLYAQFRDAYNGAAKRKKTERQLPPELNNKLKMLSEKLLGDGKNEQL